MIFYLQHIVNLCCYGSCATNLLDYLIEHCIKRLEWANQFIFKKCSLNCNKLIIHILTRISVFIISKMNSSEQLRNLLKQNLAVNYCFKGLSVYIKKNNVN